MNDQTFHVGLCMAGAVSAGAYTAGVLDYLFEAITNWEKARDSDPSIPSHKVEIDLFGGTSGGGIAAAMAFFAFRDKIEHPTLNSDGRTFQVNPENNILWKLWVELTGTDVFDQMLDSTDVNNYHIPSAMNSKFIDDIGDEFRKYLKDLSTSNTLRNPDFISNDVELFMTLFNVSGIKYKLQTKASGTFEQYVSEHRDLAHFKWGDDYVKESGCMEISATNLDNLDALIDASKATGAFPIGLKARTVSRKAKYIWDNPFFQKNGKFDKGTIDLGDNVKGEEDNYTCLNADGGTSNNEPVELMRGLLLQIRLREERKLEELENTKSMNDTERMEQKSRELENASVILIDPFPSYDFKIEEPTDKSEHVFKYAFDLIFAMNSQLRFDAKEAVDAYDKDNYGLHVIAPSKDDVEKPEHAIACGALGGFGGFLSKEYRIHDYFLGRHNCQSFLRKYFVVNPEEKKVNENGEPNNNYECVKAVIEGYKDKAALERFCFEDEAGGKWVPIIPDVTLLEPIKVGVGTDREGGKKIVYEAPHELPLYEMNLPPNNFLDQYTARISKRVNKIMNNVYHWNWAGNLLIKLAAKRYDDRVANKIIKAIKEELKSRNLIQQ